MAACQGDVLVIVAVDGSKYSDNALDFYLSKIHKPGYTVGLLHSYEKPDVVLRVPMGVEKLNMDAIEKKFRAAWDEVDRIMAKYKQICEERGVENIREFVEHGKKPGEAICAVAEKENAGLIIVGNRGQSLLCRTLLGSVSEYVVKHSKKAAVLVVPLALS